MNKQQHQQKQEKKRKQKFLYTSSIPQTILLSYISKHMHLSMYSLVSICNKEERDDLSFDNGRERNKKKNNS